MITQKTQHDQVIAHLDSPIINLNPNILEKILKKQNNKCYRKPYTTVEGLEKYSCKLWKNKNLKGSILNDKYKIIKINPAGAINENNLMILCEKCYNIRSSRKKKLDNVPNNLHEINIMPAVLVGSDIPTTAEIVVPVIAAAEIAVPVKTTVMDTVVPIRTTVADAVMPAETTVVNIVTSVRAVTICQKDIMIETILPVTKYYIIYREDHTVVYIYLEPDIKSNIINIAYSGDIFNVSKILKENDNVWIKIDNIPGYILATENKKIVADVYHDTQIKSIDKQCCICFESILKPIVLVPCGHTMFCSDCINGLKKKECPVCNIQIQQYIRLYYE